MHQIFARRYGAHVHVFHTFILAVSLLEKNREINTSTSKGDEKKWQRSILSHDRVVFLHPKRGPGNPTVIAEKRHQLLRLFAGRQIVYIFVSGVEIFAIYLAFCSTILPFRPFAASHMPALFYFSNNSSQRLVCVFRTKHEKHVVCVSSLPALAFYGPLRYHFYVFRCVAHKNYWKLQCSSSVGSAL